MKFWDSSALLPLLVAERDSRRMTALLRRDPRLFVWWASRVECVSALARLEREGALDDPQMAVALRRLRELASAWHEILPSEEVREAAQRFLRSHPLSAADALQLGAAWVASEGRPPTLELICLDRQLERAAAREGFTLAAP